MLLINLESLLADIYAGTAPKGCYGTEVVEWLKSKQVDYELMLG